MAVRCQPGGRTFEVSPSRQCTAAFWLLGGFRRENLPPHLAILTCRLLMKAARPHRIHRQCTPLKALVWKGTPQDSSKGDRDTPVLPATPLGYCPRLHLAMQVHLLNLYVCHRCNGKRKGPGFRAPPGRRGKHGPFGKCLTAWPSQKARTTVLASSNQKTKGIPPVRWVPLIDPRVKAGFEPATCAVKRRSPN